MLMGSIYRPGPRKNLVFSLYGGSAPLGFFAGVFFAGLTGQYLYFGWYFWLGAILIFTTAVSAYFAVPSDMQERKAMKVQMDWLRSALIVSGLILAVFAITDSSHAPAGWRTPYIYATLVAGALLLSLAIYVEGWIATAPLIPPDLFRIPYLTPLIIALLFSYGVLGIFLLYATLDMQTIMHATALQVAAWYVPMCLGGVLLSIVGGRILHLVPGTLLIAIAGLGWLLTSLLFALAPDGASYWAYVLPTMLGATLGINITFNVTNIFISTSMPLNQQGLAGALINSLLYLGIAVLLAFTDVVQTMMAELSTRRSYQAMF
jgi:predicted MFS family arabinose efflux permease